MTLTARLIMSLSLMAAALAPDAEPTADSIAVDKPVKLSVDSIAVERSPIGVADDYKPSIVRLKNGQLLVVAFHQHKIDPNRVREDMLLFRSDDNGKNWSESETLPLLGREPCFSALDDGMLFITTHLLEQDVRNELGYTHSYLHRSTDQAQSWESVRLAAEDIPDAAPRTWVHTGRNVLELEGGTLVLGVSAPGGRDYLWQSRDRGQTWDKSQTCEFDKIDKSKLWWPFHAETVFWQTRSGDLLALARVDPRVFPALPETQIPKEVGDQVERMMLFRSADGGRKWKFVRNLGTYGEMYPHLLRLHDGRMLLTFTVRALNPPLGVQALVGVETALGFKFDFAQDRLVIDAKTPVELPSGGGFGQTIELFDETLITVYSYRGADDKTHLEAARWKLPEAR